ncbi:hypothetical protein E3G69_000304 [Mycobacteroides abscessus]|nr:hypothetical protein [Mycobacteroides abscessus]QOF41289.1 hypothetical protein E3G69_000304 [Mycobacteroides abscessus]QOF45986.1 hypothetical protein E3G70_000301 [Mycobacteroides abscessus]
MAAGTLMVVGIEPMEDAVRWVLLRAMERRQMSKAELGRRTGYSRSRMTRILHGQAPLSIDCADRVARALGLALADVIADADALCASRPAMLPPLGERLQRGF